MSPLRKRFLIVGIIVLIIGSFLFFWMNQSPEVKPEDTEKAAEIANDDELLDAIDAGMNAEGTVTIEEVEKDSVTESAE